MDAPFLENKYSRHYLNFLGKKKRIVLLDKGIKPGRKNIMGAIGEKAKTFLNALPARFNRFCRD